MLTRDEAASLLRVSLRSVARLIARGELTSVRVGRRRLVRQRDLQALIEKNATACSAVALEEDGDDCAALAQQT